MRLLATAAPQQEMKTCVHGAAAHMECCLHHLCSLRGSRPCLLDAVTGPWPSPFLNPPQELLFQGQGGMDEAGQPMYRASMPHLCKLDQLKELCMK